MELFWQLLAMITIIIATAFSVIGVLGFIRLPDVYSRLHATGKVSVFGVVLLLISAIALTPLSVGKGLVLMFLLLIAGPVASHALGSAAYRLGLPMKQAIRDDLARKGKIDGYPTT